MYGTPSEIITSTEGEDPTITWASAGVMQDSREKAITKLTAKLINVFLIFMTLSVINVSEIFMD